MDPARIPPHEHDIDPAATRRVIDVTDRLTPGAKALVRERTATRDEAVAAYRDRLRAVTAVQHETEHTVDLTPLVQQMTRAARDRGEKMLRDAFDAGRAYERGAAIRRRVAINTATRERLVLKAAREYLEDHDDPRAARHAALVLAGFHGAPPESVA